MSRHLVALVLAVVVTFGQRIEMVEAPLIVMPGDVDSNSPAFRIKGELHLFNSTGLGPVLSSGASQFSLGSSRPSIVARQNDWPVWIEAVWADPSGTILGWYHQEHEYVCGEQRPAQPHIGAAISFDGGQTFFDQGAILSSGHPPDCSSKNGYFSGGHGDFSVMLDRQRRYFYFFFTNYAGPVETQGVAMARMAYRDRFYPLQSVWKYEGGSWTQPGVGGRLTPIFPATSSWQVEETDSFWGPAVHWNTHLRSYVLLLNRSCCGAGFPQEGIYASLNSELSNPEGWSKPEKVLADTGWYPQVLGTGPWDTDTIAGRTARLYVSGQSRWEVIFHRQPITRNVDEEPVTDVSEETPPRKRETMRK